MTVAYFGLLLALPYWLAFLPGVVLAHRIGVMLHEYIHGIPFRRYRDCLLVLSLYDGALLMFGLLELFRGTHLAHHRWLNRDGDAGFQKSYDREPAYRWLAWLSALEVSQHLGLLWKALRGGHPFVRGRRVVLGAGLSLAWVGLWVALGRPDLLWKELCITLFTSAVPVSLRGAVEHHGREGDPGFANEYRVLIPLFNLNRHIHHHEEPRRPWYLLEWRTPSPLAWHHYFTHWFHVYVWKDMTLMKPIPRRAAARAAEVSSDEDDHRAGMI